MAKRQGLGRGLSALISEEVMNAANASPTEQKKEPLIFELDLNKIRPNPDQPRKKFDEETLQELAISIKEHGILQPLVVLPEEEGYTIVAGERRFRAARIAGLERVPVIIKDLDPKAVLEIALIENVQRRDLNPLEEAMAYEKLMDDYGMTQKTLSERIGKSRSTVANTLRMLRLPQSVRQQVLEDVLSPGHAKALLSLEDQDLMIEAAEQMIKGDLTVREAEDLCRGKQIKKTKEKKRDIPIPRSPYLIDCEERMADRYATKCVINGDENRGSFLVSYHSKEEYNRIYEILMGKGGKA